MLTTTRRDKRNRRQASLTLECLDERLVLSAAAAGAAAGAVVTPHEAKVEARHEARLARVEARHEAKLAAFAAAHPASPIAIEIDGNTSASASASTSAATASASASSSAPSSPVVAATPVSSGGATPSITTATPSPTPVSQSSTATVPANVAAPLQSLYNEYEAAGSGTFKPSQPTDSQLQVSGSNVEVSIKIGSGTDFATALAQLQTDGMQVGASSATYGLVEGMLPISELPSAAQLASSVNAVPPPALS